MNTFQLIIILLLVSYNKKPIFGIFVLMAVMWVVPVLVISVWLVTIDEMGRWVAMDTCDDWLMNVVDINGTLVVRGEWLVGGVTVGELIKEVLDEWLMWGVVEW